MSRARSGGVSELVGKLSKSQAWPGLSSRIFKGNYLGLASEEREAVPKPFETPQTQVRLKRTRAPCNAERKETKGLGRAPLWGGRDQA